MYASCYMYVLVTIATNYKFSLSGDNKNLQNVKYKKNLTMSKNLNQSVTITINKIVENNN